MESRMAEQIGHTLSPQRPWARKLTILWKIVNVTTLLVAVGFAIAIMSSSSDNAEAGPSFICSSSLRLGSPVLAERKGLAVDDTTLQGCPGRMLAAWPNTDAKVLSLRFFKAWDRAWPDDQRLPAWRSILAFTRRNKAKVLLGTQITCSEEDDDMDWANALELLKMLGPEHVMGVAVGNELELLQYKDKHIVPAECVLNIWQGGYLLRKFQERVHDVDKAGFGHLPVTSAFGSAIMAGSPFVNVPSATVLDFLTKVISQYGARWVYSLNIYPYFDPSNKLDPGTTDQCIGAIGRAHCFDDPRKCVFAAQLKSMRNRMQQISSQNRVLWITETGWSSPMSTTLNGNAMSGCPEFSSRNSFEAYYDHFLSWNMQVLGAQSPDHIFYFTMRDSTNFGVGEHFGLLEGCTSQSCKFQAAAWPGALHPLRSTALRLAV